MNQDRTTSVDSNSGELHINNRIHVSSDADGKSDCFEGKGYRRRVEVGVDRIVNPHASKGTCRMSFERALSYIYASL